MQFVATRLESDGVPYGFDFEAETWKDAEDLCRSSGWRLDGELISTEPASDFLCSMLQRSTSSVAIGLGDK